MEGEKKRPANNGSFANGRMGNPESSFQSGNRQDPYVIRAAEKAKNKLRDRILGLNGGHLN